LESIKTELDLIYNSTERITRIHIADPYFNAHPELNKICHLLSKYSDKFIYSADLRLDAMNAKKVDLLSQANIRYVRFGLENVDPTYSKFGGDQPQQLIDISKLFRKITPNTALYGYWLTGLPGMDEQSMLRMQRLFNFLSRTVLLILLATKSWFPIQAQCFSIRQKNMVSKYYIILGNYMIDSHILFSIYQVIALNKFMMVFFFKKKSSLKHIKK
jgi:hypothetical protein